MGENLVAVVEGERVSYNAKSDGVVVGRLEVNSLV